MQPMITITLFQRSVDFLKKMCKMLINLNYLVIYRALSGYACYSYDFQKHLPAGKLCHVAFKILLLFSTFLMSQFRQNLC